MNKTKETKKKCFVIMPFSNTTDSETGEECTVDYWNNFFNFIKKAVEETAENLDLDYECIKSSADSRNIVDGILDELVDADIVLAILTDFNPNVFYELGTRHAIRSGTIMIIKDSQSIPFDIGQYGVISYDKDILVKPNEKEKFKKELERYINNIETQSYIDSPALDAFSKRPAKPCWVASTVKDSPFDLFDNALNNVEKKLFIVGQNLYAFTQDRHKFKDKLFDLLKNKPVHVDVLICDLTDRNFIESMKKRTAEEFEQHLKQATEAFNDWEKEIREDNEYKGSFNLKSSKKIGTTSLTFFDPGTYKGSLLITPIVEPHAFGRSCFWITERDHRCIFNYYFKVFSAMLDKPTSQYIQSRRRK